MIDYQTLSEEDEELLNQIQEREIVYHHGKPTRIRKSLYHEYPKAARHFLSLFPIKFMDRLELKNEKAIFNTRLEEFKILLDKPGTTERNILNFLNQYDAKFIPASVIKRGYTFGHHALFLFPEFPLTVNHKPDFLIVGKNSDGYHYIFIELENPVKDITLGNGTYGTTLRKGIIQVEDWSYWLQKNYSALKPVYDKDRKAGELLPDEFTEYDKTRVHFVVIAGRRSDFKDETRRRNRELLQSQSIQIMHYDNLIEAAENALNTESY